MSRSTIALFCVIAYYMYANPRGINERVSAFGYTAAIPKSSRGRIIWCEGLDFTFVVSALVGWSRRKLNWTAGSTTLLIVLAASCLGRGDYCVCHLAYGATLACLCVTLQEEERRVFRHVKAAVREKNAHAFVHSIIRTTKVAVVFCRS